MLSAMICLALNVYHEARGEPLDGQVAVAQVTMNRVASKRYPNTVCEVVYQKSQFSWTRHNPPVTEPAELMKAFFLVLQLDTFDNFTGGATHYYAHNKTTPYWSSKLTLVGSLGNHTFMLE